MNKLFSSITALLVVLFMGAAVNGALAQTLSSQADPTSPDLIDLLRPVWAAISGGNYALAAAAVVVVIGAVLTRWGASLWSWFGSGSGRAVIILVTSFGAALYAGLSAGAPFTLGIVWGALKLGVTAAGVYSLANALVLEPLERWVARGAPKPVRWLAVALRALINRVAPPPAPAALLTGDLDPVTGETGKQRMARPSTSRDGDQ